MRSVVREILQGAVLLVATLLTACGGGTNTSIPSPVVDGPTVASTFPALEAKGVALNGVVTVSFNRPVIASTVSSATFVLDQGASGNVSCDGVTATYTPASPLASSTRYTATLTTGIKDANGRSLTAPYTWSFTTGAAVDTAPPSVSAISPLLNATGVATNASITATFSEPLAAATVTAGGSFTLKNGNINVPGTVTYNGITATFTPTNLLAASTVYVASISKNVTDAAGNAIVAPYSWSFTTGAAPDTTPPVVSSTTPTNGASNVGVNTAVSATFSESMDANSVMGSFTLSAGGTPLAGTVTYNNLVATFTPNSVLNNGVTYTATLSTGAKDTSGNALASAKSWSFTTAAGVTAPAISTQPQSTSVVSGQQASFSVVATGSAPLTYQWRKGGVNITGANSASYTTPATTVADNNAQFTVLVSNSAGNASSSPAVLTVQEVAPVTNGSRYLSGRILSPITPTVATSLKALYAQGTAKGLKSNVFFKVGDSISAGPGDYLSQFTYPAYDAATMHDWDYAHDLGNYQSLKGARDYFKTGVIGSDDPYTRTSLSAKVAQVASWALGIQGGQTNHPMQEEFQATQGAYAIIMFGTNNFYPWNGTSDAQDAATYQEIVENSFKMLDYCIVNGSVPILTAPPPDPVEPTAMKRSRMTSRLIRAVSQGRQIPFIDYYASLLDLPGYGLQTNDVHPNSLSYNRVAFLTTAGLQYGYNMRNLVTLQTLDRMYRLLVLNGTAPDTETGGLQGTGTAVDPYVIDGTDFADYQAPANGATNAYYKLTVTTGEVWQFAAAGQVAAVSGIEVRSSGGAIVQSSSVGAMMTSTLAAGTYTIKVSFPSTVGGYVFAALANSGR